MKTRRSISIHFAQVMTQARTLDRCARELRQIQGEMDNILGQLGAEWKGESASLYLEKCDRLNQKIQRSSSNLSQVSGVIQRSARAYYEAELRALDRIHTKNQS